MAEKVKVSREVAKVLDEVRACHEPTIDDFIKRHAIGDVGPDWKVLKQYRTMFVAHLIYTGDYEIEQTPEEILLEAIKAPFLPPGYCNNFNNGVQFALKTLGTKSKESISR